MFLVQLFVQYKIDSLLSEYVPYEDSNLVVWGSDMEDLKEFANQWVSQGKEGENRRYFIRLLKPLGTSEVVYYSW